MNLFVHEASVIGECVRCYEPTTGSFNSDDDRVGEDENFIVKLECVNCHEKYAYRLQPTIYNCEPFDKTREE